MRVLILSLNYYPRFIGGAEVAIKEITDRLPDVEFHMITLRFDSALPKTEKVGNVVVHRIGFVAKNPSINDLRRFPLHLNKFLFQFAAFLEARALHEQKSFDALWAMMAHSCAVPAGLFKRVYPSVPYLLTLQEGDPPEAIERTMRPLASLFAYGFRSADAIQAISTFLLAWARRMGATGYGKVVPNGVDTARFARTFSTEEKAAAERELGKEPGDTYLVTTSRLVHKNALDDVIAALPLLPESVSFIVYGIGPDEAKLKALAGELGVAKRVRFMGAIGHEAMPSALSACDIFIRPSRSEGMGNSFVEAMAAGLPVIATREGGLSDFIFDAAHTPEQEPTAWVVAKDSPKEIAAAVEGILADSAKTASVVATAKALALRDFDWELVAREMRTIFTRLEGKIDNA